MVRARERARMALEQLYEDRATIYRRVKLRDPETGISATEDEVLFDNLPCRLSFSKSYAADISESIDAVSQTIKLFYPVNIRIPAGCRIEIYRGEDLAIYHNSGMEMVYATHRETELIAVKEYA